MNDNGTNNSNVTFYTTHCPKCAVLEAKLKEKNIEYTTCEDADLMVSKGMMSAPGLEVDGRMMTFGEAVKWINNL